MKLEDRFSLDGVTITVRNTMRQDIRWEAMLRAFPIGEADGPEGYSRTCFFYANIYTFHIEGDGLAWRPSERLDSATLEASYQTFLDAVSRQLADLWLEKAHGLREPLADLVERPDNTLTPEQAADPN